MEGRIYISGVFTTVNRNKCGGGVGWLDNDPHFWRPPPTWGICRTDFRRVIKAGDYIFFVLAKASELPQMVYGYFKVRERITHVEAFCCPDLRHKRMGNKVPNGNIIVDAHGRYSRFDGGYHKNRFDEIKPYYVIGDRNESEFLSEERIRQLAPGFVAVLNRLFGTRKNSVFGIIGRKGRRMSEEQVRRLLAWLRH
ncbi:MAG: hypothetical protein WB763_22590 [Terriglobia bacterium]|jgi:hypothetical protein